MATEFQRRHTLEHRRAEAARIQRQFPGRIPVIVERSSRTTDVPPPQKNKFLAPSELTMGQFIYILRKNMKLPPEKALFVFIGGTLPATSILVSELYRDYRADDGFLYMVYSGESTFGMGDVLSVENELRSFSTYPQTPSPLLRVHPSPILKVEAQLGVWHSIHMLYRQQVRPNLDVS